MSIYRDTGNFSPPRTPPETSGASSRQAVEEALVDHIEPETSNKRRRVESQASSVQMRDATASRLNLTPETATVDAWEVELNHWVQGADGETVSEEEKTGRETAKIRIEACIRENGAKLDLKALNLSSLPSVLHHCKNLQELYCSGNRLTTLNLNGCSTLQELDCSDNELASLNLNDSSRLKKLACYCNELTSLSFDNESNLESLSCTYNQLTSLNLNGCRRLKELYSNDNELTSLNLDSCKRTLKILNCSNNGLNALNLNGCRSLQEVDCSNNQLTALNLGGCRRLKELYCQNNPQLLEFDLQCLPQMNHLTHLSLEETGIVWNQLPEAIQNRQALHIDIRPQYLRDQALNADQNTHTASIHQAATQTAEMLKGNNPEKDLNQAYEDFCRWVNQQPVNDAAISEAGYANQAYKNAAAQSWVRQPSHLDHQDADSGVNVKAFLALAWLAINDPEQRETHLSEAQARNVLIEALYEIRRGYNLNEDPNPKDDGQPARNICAGGTFNKIYEKLTSVVKGVDFVMITGETLLMKMKAIITEEVRKRLEQESRDGKDTIKKELEESENYLTHNIWGHIKAPVIESVQQAFPGNPTIGGKTLEQHLSEFESTFEYMKLEF